MKKQWIVTTGIFLLTLVLSTGLQAQAKHRGGQGSQYAHQGNQFHGKALDLSEDQQSELKSLRLENYTSMKPLKNKMAELKAKERTLMSEQKVNLNEVNSVIDEQTKLSSQIRKMQAAHKVKVKSVFTDEQLMKLEQHKKIRKHRKAWAPGSQGRQGRQGMERPI